MVHMAPRIKVTGYINLTALEPEHVDSSHHSGLSEEGYEEMHMTLGDQLDGLDFELVK